MAAVLENTPAQTQVRPSFEGTCGEDATASRSCLQDGAGDKPSIAKSHELGAPRTDEGGINFDFQKSGCQTATKTYFPARPSPGGHSFHSIQNWATIDLHQQPEHDDSPSKRSDISICAPHADEFDEAINNLTKNNDIGLENNPQESIVPCADNLVTKYMEEYKPESASPPPPLPLNGDLAKTINLCCDTKLSADKLKERRLREMRSENIDLFMRTTNSSIFKLHCGGVSHARNTDRKLQHVEQNVVKATYPRAVEDLQKLQHPAIAPDIAKIMDGIILLTDTVQDCEQTRRDLYKNVIPECWKRLLEKTE